MAHARGAVHAGVMSALSRVGLAGREQTIAGTLSYGHQRLLEVAMGLALKPRLLILDEPTQGLSDGEIENFITLVREIAREATVLIIEHNMPVVMQLADRITVMNAGKILAEGTPRTNPRQRRRAARLSRHTRGGQCGWLTSLTISGLDCFYGETQILYGLDLSLRQGEVHCLLGRNGAGKTTALKAIMGLAPARAGSIRLGSVELTELAPHEVPKAGVAYVPQGRRLFAEMTVAENIEIGLMARGKGKTEREAVLDLFPILRERLKQRSGTLSGGEQQMLAMARALCLEPQVLLLDEPTEGLMPSMIAKIRETVARLRQRGVSTILVEQRVDAVLPVADRVSFIENGRVRETVEVGRLRDEPELVKRYVGVS